MTRVQGLFYSTDTERQTLHRRIVPSAAQQEQQRERWNDLCEFLINNLEEVGDYDISSWLQGSYKFGTQVRPVRKGEEFDIDLGLYFNWEGNTAAATTSPATFKRLVQASMKTYAAEAGDDVIEVVEPAKERCNRIRFTDDFHIDVPVYHLDPTEDHRDLATESKGWEKSDPKAFYLWFRETFSDEDSDLVRRLIRYMKVWAAMNLSAPPSSVLLTVLVAEAYLAASEEEIGTDDMALRHVASQIADRLELEAAVPNPANPAENLNRLDYDQNSVFIEELRQLVDCADRALAAPNEVATAAVWSEVFAHFFPVPEVDASDTVGKALIPVQFVPRVRVFAQNSTNKNIQYRGNDRIGPIVRGCVIKFTLENAAELPAGATVEWTARNQGEEAELVNDMGHRAGQGTEILDHSAYYGTHSMDVVAKSAFGEVIGFARIPVEIIDMKAAPRNPKKPGYLRYYNRRRH